MKEIKEDSEKEIQAILEAFHYDGSRLIDILLQVQANNPQQYISQSAAVLIAQQLEISMVQVYEVASFYSAISLAPRAKYPIQICNSIVCKVTEKENLLRGFQSLLGIGINEPTADGKFILELVPCFGACDIAPAVRINGKVYGHLTDNDKLSAVLEQCL